ncbi:radical SAM family heme chaperone HemW, partial [Candidatus Margulisiibacteriota bacterium]
SYAGREDLIPEYIEALKSEIGYMSSLMDKPVISTIYLGGGTPTLMDTEATQKLFDVIYSDFNVVKDAEISIESNPKTADKGKLKNLINCGVNRLSIGAQSFDNRILKKLGRIHLNHDITEIFELAREVGFRNINLDLMFAIPSQGMKDWMSSLESAISLKPEHISTYNLQIEEGTPFYEELQEGTIKPPEEELEYNMYKDCITLLLSKGYRQYEISNFAKKGFECKHNITYWTMQDYIGVGAGAHSFIQGIRSNNTPDLDKYLTKKFDEIKSDHKLSAKENMAEMVFLGLRMLEGLPLRRFLNKFKFNLLNVYSKEIEELKKEGLVTVDSKAIKLTLKGLFLANEVFKKFL